jgi:hypothetical protein
MSMETRHETALDLINKYRDIPNPNLIQVTSEYTEPLALLIRIAAETLYPDAMCWHGDKESVYCDDVEVTIPDAAERISNQVAEVALAFHNGQALDQDDRTYIGYSMLELAAMCLSYLATYHASPEDAKTLFKWLAIGVEERYRLKTTGVTR